MADLKSATDTSLVAQFHETFSISELSLFPRDHRDGSDIVTSADRWFQKETKHLPIGIQGARSNFAWSSSVRDMKQRRCTVAVRK
jgi:hypothetical protein